MPVLNFKLMHFQNRLLFLLKKFRLRVTWKCSLHYIQV